MTTKNILRKNYFSIRQNTLAFFARGGRKLMEAHVRIYSRWQQSKRDLVYGGLGLVPWIKAHPILTAALAYGAYRAWPYLGDNWLSRNLGRAASAGAAVGGAVSDVAETISQQPENLQQLGRAGVELGQTVGEIGLNLAQSTVETAQEMGQGVVRAGDLATETVVLGLDSVATRAADALVERPTLLFCITQTT